MNGFRALSLGAVPLAVALSWCACQTTQEPHADAAPGAEGVTPVMAAEVSGTPPAVDPGAGGASQRQVAEATPTVVSDAEPDAAPTAPPVEGQAQAGCAPWKAPSLEKPGATDALLPTGLASGGVRADSVKLWARTSRAARVQMVLRAGPECSPVEAPWQDTRAEDDHVLHFRVDGLQPGTLYSYQARIEGEAELSTPGWFRTAPQGDAPARLAFSADVAGFADQVAFIDKLIDAAPDLYLSLGDWPYVDLLEDPRAAPEFNRYYAQSRSGQRMARMTRSMPIHAVWDDHEVINDWDARYGKWHPERVEAGTDIWRRWWLVEGAPEGEIYRNHRWGAGLELFYLDTRSHRVSNGAADGPEKTMLGEAQRRWLLSALSASQATFKLVITSIPLDYGITGKDQWSGFKHERDLVLAHIAEQRIGGVVFLAADQHYYASHHLPVGVRQWQVGPLAFKTFKPPRQPVPETMIQGRGRNFGVVEYQPGPTPTLTFSVVVEREGTVYTEVLRAGRGTIAVEAPEGWGWRLEGAHRFMGRGPATLALAPPGDYTVTWSPPAGAKTPAPGSALLADGARIAFAP